MNHHHSVIPSLALALTCAAFVGTGSCLLRAQATEKVLYSFRGWPTDGQAPNSSLVSDRAGNLYGTTSGGGIYGAGTIFELSPNPDGTWSESVLYSFCYYDSVCPQGDFTNGLTIDAAGNLYGVASSGGPPCLGFDTGCGLAFELSPPTIEGSPWNYTIIYSFCSVGQYCEDGIGPAGPLTFDQSGNLYGTTFSGGQNQGQGSNYSGTVFELSPGPSGWTEKVLYSFCSVSEGNYCLDGGGPDMGVVFGKAGNLYGTTAYGGSASFYAGGVLFELSPGSTGWTERVLYVLPVHDEYQNYPGPVSFDPNGNFYTTLTASGDRQHYTNGLVARVSATGGGRTFLFNGSNGRGPEHGVLIDAGRHRIYGTTIGGSMGPGNVYQIDELGNESVLYTFCQQFECADGSSPGGGLLEDESGNLFGGTGLGGFN